MSPKMDIRQYWEDLLRGHYEPIQLGIPGGSSVEHKASKQISAKLKSNGLQKIVGHCKCDLDVALYALWGVLLSKYSDCDDVVFGVPNANANFMPLRLKINSKTTVQSLLQNAQKQYKQSLEFCDISTEVTLPEFHYVAYVDGSLPSTHSVRSGQVDSKLLGTKTLSLGFKVVEDQLHYTIHYNASYPEWIMQQMSDHFQNLINKFIELPNAKVFDISCMSEGELNKILYEWNDTAADYPRDKTIHQLFEEQVERTPNNVAVVFEDQQLTYKELNQKANQLAHYLRKTYKEKFGEALKPDTLIAICVDRSLEMIVGILGILKAGGAYVPIDPEYPEERIGFMLGDAESKLVLTQKVILEKNPFLSSNSRDVVCLDDQQSISQYSGSNLAAINDANNLAYVIYTSGSTGVPKGVLIEHAGIVNLAFAEIQRFSIVQSSRALCFAPFGFDAFTFEIYATLFAGGTLYITLKEKILPGTSLANTIDENKISFVVLVPSALQLTPLRSKHLQTVVVASEACSKQLLQSYKDKYSFVNAYGPTETTVCATMMQYDGTENGHISIGGPIENFQAYVLNKHLQPLPVNVPGELHIGGDGLARGYLNRPELTAEKFIKNPFSEDRNSRLYKTGDLVRWLPDGNLEFLGRIDDQVKIRGFRIELGEVETHLGKHSGISQSVVLAKKDDNGNNYLAGYLVPANNADIEHHQVRQHLQQTLPDYMIPEQFITLGQLPLTPNGKVNKQALLELQSVVAVEPTLPANSLEMDIAGVFRELIQKDEIDSGRNFFEMGVHSFLVVQASNTLSTKLQTAINPVDIFTYPTVRSLAAYVNRTCAQPSEGLVQANGDKLDKKKKYLARRKDRHGRD